LPIRGPGVCREAGLWPVERRGPMPVTGDPCNRAKAWELVKPNVSWPRVGVVTARQWITTWELAWPERVGDSCEGNALKGETLTAVARNKATKLESAWKPLRG